MILFTGVAGSGKSLQGRRLADTKGYPWLSTGEFLRMVLAGEKRKEMIEGKLLADDEVIPIVEKIFGLIDVQSEFVLDGFPRTKKQADWLLQTSRDKNSPISLVVHLTASKDTVVDRLIERGRKDDNPEAIDERFEEYEKAIKPILSLCREQGFPVVDIDAENSPDDIHQLILEATKEYVSGA